MSIAVSKQLGQDSRHGFICTVCRACFYALSLAITAPCALICWLEKSLAPGREGVFLFWAHLLALAPGLPGAYLRRGFYRQTLDACAGNFYVGFGAYFTHRMVCVEGGVYIGSYALIGSAILRKNCMIGSRASLLSGGALHPMDENGNWLPCDLSLIRQIEIGENAWLGEGVIVMTNVGTRAMVAAGSVVSAPVPERVMVAGNPARFVKYVTSSAELSGSPPGFEAQSVHLPDLPYGAEV
jgi:acetyltransferase-like isoleucine patch superfamily enzyme